MNKPVGMPDHVKAAASAAVGVARSTGGLAGAKVAKPTPGANADVVAGSGDNARLRLSALRALTPIFRSIVVRPGLAKEPVEPIESLENHDFLGAHDFMATVTTDDTVRVAAFLLERVELIAAELAPAVAGDKAMTGNAWFRAQIKEYVCELVAEAWRAGDSDDMATTVESRLTQVIPLIKEVFRAPKLDSALSGLDQVYPEGMSHAEATLRATLMKAMEPLVREVMVFSFFQPKPVLLSYLTEAVVTFATSEADRLQFSSESGRHMTIQNHINQFAKLLYSEFQSVSIDTAGELVKKTPEQRMEWRRANRDGMAAVDRALDGAKQHFRMLEEAAGASVKLVDATKPRNGARP